MRTPRPFIRVHPCLIVCLLGIWGILLLGAQWMTAPHAAFASTLTHVTLTPVLDTFVDSAEAQPHSSDHTLLVSFGANDNRIRHTLLLFDLAGIPANATVTSATLTLRQTAANGVGAVMLSTAPATDQWHGTVVWPGPGTGGLTALLAVDHSLGDKHWDVTALVAALVNGASPNFGFVLQGPQTGESFERVFASAETGEQPMLTIDFTIAATPTATSAEATATPASSPTTTTTTTVKISRTYEVPPQGCLGFNRFIVNVTANPNLGTVWPTVLVARGTPVQLIGTAERQQRIGDCQTTISALPFTWSATFQSPNESSPVDASASLVGTNTLNPTLNANGIGTYVVQLATNPASFTATINIDVIENGIRWVNIGPDGRPARNTGRVNAIAFDKTRPRTIYIGTGQGGVWKSSYGGATWQPMTDNKGLPTLGIGALAVAPDGSAVYAGTGDPNYAGGGDAARPGNGVYKSTDGGVTWNPTGTGGPSCAIAPGIIHRILIDPTDPSILFAAGDIGIYRSNNGGDCWVSIRTNPGIVYDLAFVPQDPTKMYAVTENNGVIRTLDVRASPPTWFQSQTWFTRVLRGGVAVSDASPQIVYASFVYNFYGRKRVQEFRSTDQGRNWEWLPMPDALGFCTNSQQCDYNFALIADPSDPTVIFHGDVPVWRFQYPQGRSPQKSDWVDWSGPGSRTPNALAFDIHGDVHALAFDPNNPSKLYEGDDGGVFRFNLGSFEYAALSNWTMLNTNLSIAQFRSIGVNPNWQGDVAGGLQDNGTQRRLSGRTWFGLQGGDGWWASYDALARPESRSSIIYFDQNSGFNGDMLRYDPNTSGKPLITSVSEFQSDPFRQGVMVASPVEASVPVTRGQLFYARGVDTIPRVDWTCIDPTPGQPGVLADAVTAFAPARVFPSGSGGVYYVGMNWGGIYLVNVPQSPASFPGCGPNASAATPTEIYVPYSLGWAVTGLAEDPARPCVLYATIPNEPSRPWRIVQLRGSLSSMAGCTNWSDPTPIAANLPPDLTGSFPNYIHDHAIAFDPLMGNLYVGTDRGLYIGAYDGSTWNWTRSLDVPDTTVTDIRAHVNASGSNGIVYLSTYGRGVYERVLSGALAAGASQANQTAMSDDEIYRCQVREQEDPALHWHIADVEVDYSYSGSRGHNIWLRPVVTEAGAASPYFIREIRHVGNGIGTLNMQVIYGSVDAPPGLTTDGLRVEMFQEQGPPFLARECHFTKIWRRTDAIVIQVRAENLPHEGAVNEVFVPITITLSNGAVESRVTPFSLFASQGLRVTLQAPAIRTIDKVHALHQWFLFGHEVRFDSPSLSFTASDDTSAVVHYIGLEHKVFLPVVLGRR